MTDHIDIPKSSKSKSLNKYATKQLLKNVINDLQNSNKAVNMQHRSGKKQKANSENEEKQADTLINIAESNVKYITDIRKVTYAVVNNSGCKEIYRLDSKEFARLLTQWFFELKGTAVSKDAINQALNVMDALAAKQGKTKELFNRIGLVKGTFYYDLNNKKRQIVKVTKDKVKIVNKSRCYFFRNNNMLPQVKPDLSSNKDTFIEAIQKYFRTRNEDELILLCVYIISCFVPQIGRVILLYHGEMGSSKSTSLKMLQKIVDPVYQELLSKPDSKKDLILTLADSHLVAFDNLSSLKSEMCDILCIAATGGYHTTRTLYTTAEKTVFKLKQAVALNGINIITTRPDFLDRCIVISKDRIPENEIKPENALLREFNDDLPRIMGAVFNILSRSKSAYTEDIPNLKRMADFTLWGYAIAEALGFGGERFLTAYKNNQAYANSEVLESNPLAKTILVFMKKRKNWKGSPSELYTKLSVIASEEGINKYDKSWPGDASVMSRRINFIKPNLKSSGISIGTKHSGGRTITLENLNLKGKKIKKHPSDKRDETRKKAAQRNRREDKNSVNKAIKDC